MGCRLLYNSPNLLIEEDHFAHAPGLALSASANGRKFSDVLGAHGAFRGFFPYVWSSGAGQVAQSAFPVVQRTNDPFLSIARPAESTPYGTHLSLVGRTRRPRPRRPASCRISQIITCGVTARAAGRTEPFAQAFQQGKTSCEQSFDRYAQAYLALLAADPR
jgi:hypothetical protein